MFLVLAYHVEKARSLFSLGGFQDFQEACAAGDWLDVCAAQKG